MNYHAKVLGIIEGGWGSKRIGVYLDDALIGEYVRNYSSYGDETFCPFEQDGKWYALYSKHYTCTRLMSLPDCKDIGGEEPASHGFCPVDYCVPVVCAKEHPVGDKCPVVANHQADKWATIVDRRCYWPDDKDHPEPNEERKQAYLNAYEESHKAANEWCDKYPYVEKHARFAFVCGCVWGDDSSWKLQVFDLSKVSDGIITRDDRFGYVEVSSPLEQYVEADYENHLDQDFSKVRVHVYQKTYYDMTGKKRE